MKDYSAMSDFEINGAVAKLFPKIYSFNVEGYPYSLVLDAMASYSGDDYDEVVFAPCNSWSDAGPIIEANNIGLEKQLEICCENCNEFLDTGVWWAIDPLNYINSTTNSNPLRAAMIVFLMMKSQP